MASLASDLRQQVLDHQFSSTRYNSAIITYLDEGQSIIGKQVDLRIWEDTEDYATIASTVAYALPDDYNRIIDLRDTDARAELHQLNTTTFDQLRTSSGRPSGFVVYGNDFHLYPTPDQAYNLELRHYRKPTAITSGGDTTDLPDEYDDLLVHWALHRCYMQEHDYDAAQAHKDQFEMRLLKMRGEMQYDSVDPPKVIGGTWGNSSVPGWDRY